MHDARAFGRWSSTALAGLLAAALSGCGDGGAGLQPPAAVRTAALETADKAVPDPAEPAPKMETLRGVAPPDPAGTEAGRSVGLADYVRDRAAAVRLGKALFWDMNVGSDGTTACASCHFQAGADNRIKNQINPGLANVDPGVGRVFNKPAASPIWGPNHTLALADFPLHKLADVADRDSAIRSTTDDVISSQGVFDGTFTRPGQSRFDDCTLRTDEIFHVQGVSTRRVPPRNSPTVINAALNVRNFWDGRANNVFNGFSPFGERDPDAGIWVSGGPGGEAAKVRLALRDASAASQAVGPPGSDIEMTCGGRSFPNLARRILDQPALNRQAIAPDDSVLRDFGRGGLKPKYRELIQAAFQPRLWNAPGMLDIDGPQANGPLYSQIEANFPLFFGLAIQLYEATLVSDQAPLDAYLQGDKSALTAQEVRGMQLFAGKGQCINCHGGPELTNAATRLRLMPQERVERMAMGDGQTAFYDNGFYNIGVRPTSEDLGVGERDPWGHPLSFTRQFLDRLTGRTGATPDSFQVDPCKFAVLESPCSDPSQLRSNTRDAVDGAFKTPGLRNVELTGPYFHNGDSATLEQVVEFYNRGGNRRGSNAVNTSGFGPNGSNLDADIKPLGLTASERADLVAFLKRPLTDARVAWERAPFDHPALEIPDGHIGDATRVAGPTQPNRPHRAQDVNRRLPAVGSGGRSNREGPLQPFHTQLR